MYARVSDHRERIGRESGYADEYGDAAARGLPSISFLASALFAGFAIFDVLTHSSEEIAWRLGVSLIPALALLAVGLIARTRFVTYQNAPGLAACAGIIGQCAPLATIIHSKYEIDLLYFLLIMAAGGALIFRMRPFLTMIAVSVLFFGVSIGLLDASTEDKGDWIAALFIGIGLACALFISQRSAVRRYADAESRLSFLAGHDPLTGLLNRNGLENKSSALLALAQREKRRVFAIFIDIDGLSEINNVHGHLAGDLVISEIAVATTRLVRAADLVARWGGDELVIIGVGDGPDPDRVEAVIRADLTLALQNSQIDGSISAGLATLKGEAVSTSALIHLADAQMYERRSLRRSAQKLP
ncbi:diguanylate cyclase (GGDEF) domain-containing protein [Actinobacteria bacterium IMCC26256]|nr:diguanylate cyclase (GGDEF) domain-containing protein [Actinobacteria bacterium IMCC26256]